MVQGERAKKIPEGAAAPLLPAPMLKVSFLVVKTVKWKRGINEE